MEGKSGDKTTWVASVGVGTRVREGLEYCESREDKGKST